MDDQEDFDKPAFYEPDEKPVHRSVYKVVWAAITWGADRECQQRCYSRGCIQNLHMHYGLHNPTRHTSGVNRCSWCRVRTGGASKRVLLRFASLQRQRLFVHGERLPAAVRGRVRQDQVRVL